MKVKITEGDVRCLLRIRALARKADIAHWLKEQEAAAAIHTDRFQQDLHALMEEVLAVSSVSDWTDVVADVELADAEKDGLR